jgi:hypothetical protein
MREGEAFRGEPVLINCRYDSSGLNLSCEGLLLEMQDEDRKEDPDEAPCWGLVPQVPWVIGYGSTTWIRPAPPT